MKDLVFKSYFDAIIKIQVKLAKIEGVMVFEYEEIDIMDAFATLQDMPDSFRVLRSQFNAERGTSFSSLQMIPNDNVSQYNMDRRTSFSSLQMIPNDSMQNYVPYR